ncbi:hypothetical protein BS78_07G103800 [Paspalum vaginatum]|nr:hypothetical protein BS78_07G103800 [Paspalum vaginatum]
MTAVGGHVRVHMHVAGRRWLGRLMGAVSAFNDLRGRASRVGPASASRVAVRRIRSALSSSSAARSGAAGTARSTCPPVGLLAEPRPPRAPAPPLGDTAAVPSPCIVRARPFPSLS